MNDFVCVFKTYDAFKANAVKEKLQSFNIDCHIKRHESNGAAPHLAFIQSGIQILVLEKDAKKSIEFIEQLQI